MTTALYQSLHVWSSTYRTDIGRLPPKITDQLLKVARLASLVDDQLGDFINPAQYPDRVELRRELAVLERILASP